MKKRLEILSDYFVIGGTIILVGWLCFGIARLVVGGEVFSTTVFMRDVSVGSWAAPTSVTNTFTTGGTYTNGTYTNYYRVSATNDLGRLPVSSVLTVTFVGNTNTTNAVVVHWAKQAGMNQWIVEKSTDGVNWSNWVDVGTGGQATNFTDLGTNITTWTIFTNVSATLIPAPSVPWPTGGTGLISEITVSGGLLTGGGTSGIVDIGLTTNTVTNTVAQSWPNLDTDNTDELLLDGSRSMAGDLDMGGYSITNVGTNSIDFSDGSRLTVDSTAIYYISADGTTTNDLTAPAQTNGLASTNYVNTQDTSISNSLVSYTDAATNNLDPVAHTGEVDPGFAAISNEVVYTNDATYTDTVAKADSALQAESDTLQAVMNRGRQASTNLDMNNYSIDNVKNIDVLSGGTPIFLAGSRGAGAYGWIDVFSQVTLGNRGSAFYGYMEAAEATNSTVYISGDGGVVRGFVQVGYGAYATNQGNASIGLIYLTGTESQLITANESIGVGACTVSDERSIVVGDSQISHGAETITAGGGFYGPSTTSLNWMVNYQTMTNVILSGTIWQQLPAATNDLTSGRLWNSNGCVRVIP